MAEEGARAPGGRGRLAAAANPLFGVGSQILNSATNALTAFVASWALSPDDFGRFALSYAVVLVLLAGGRGLLGGSIVSHLPSVEPAERRAQALSALGTTWLVGAVGTVVLAGTALVVPNVGWFVPWVAVALVQDAGRYLYIAERRAGVAFLLDVVWAAVQGAAILAVVTAGRELSIGVVTTAWGLGALAGTVALVVVFRGVAGAPGPWLGATRDIGGWWTASSILGQVEVYSVLFVTQVALSATAVGGLRAVQLITVQPATLLAGSILWLATPTFARLGPDAPTAAYRRAERTVWLTLVPALAFLALVVVLSGPVMDLALPQYAEFEPLVVPTALVTLSGIAGVPAQSLMRGLRKGALVFVLQVARVAGILGGATAGAAVAGLHGLAWGQVVGVVLPLAFLLVAGRRLTSGRG